ncbi:hypothetical protein SEA_SPARKLEGODDESS_96 [Streptomyces phage SparkleGoddess]|uniref:Uncharacterized protein n=2 Tax=Gilsonvirus comrade TaxID=2846395 RepID=A0A345ME23_9CAUD|nr:hypothetical protein SEA_SPARKLEGODDESS_96 [Streptomyces phage SparkleGoddess]QQO39779.1 hypothetical protein SEA_BELFORT_98 [Streptomyces phage Belfort]QZE11687.1 hypothetical protein SEA_KARP_94 [Streptomyces phage Karp]UTN92346.1 hypothetical protein SEA_STIGMA_95 [Streptomyces phage Stigma]
MRRIKALIKTLVASKLFKVALDKWKQRKYRSNK